MTIGRDQLSKAKTVRWPASDVELLVEEREVVADLRQ
jgi:hypothetical protein